ncbi:dihydrofolate reductase [Candidatus Nomurabacteria bacterium]|nr:dihydrofolate reductase [Candidatus Nomurabacteria bacterium]
MKSIIVAMDKNNGIGAKGDLPWGRSLPDDLAHFKKLTTGGSVIMGRKTFESIGSKPLPNRENIVVSSRPTGVQGVLTARSMPAALALARYEVFFIGGEDIFLEALNEVDAIHATMIDAEFPEADVFFPQINSQDWREVSRNHHEADKDNKYAFDIVEYERA